MPAKGIAQSSKMSRSRKCFDNTMILFGLTFLLDCSMFYLVNAQDYPCMKFSEIYSDGKDLCERMWGNSFTVEENDESKGYTMWFFDENNPNQAVSEALGKLGVDEQITDCHLSYYHKEAPTAEPDTFTECHPWKDYSCCSEAVVMSADKLNEAYGEEYHWDRCGPLSRECEAFFVQEACFYECDPHAGLFRKFHTEEDLLHEDNPIYDPKCDKYNDNFDENEVCEHNEWEMYKMPIKRSYCDAWFNACRDDSFCGDGDFFACAKKYLVENDESSNNDDGLNSGVIVLIVILSVLASILLVILAIGIFRERRGKPLFSKMEEPLTGGCPPKLNADTDGIGRPSMEGGASPSEVRIEAMEETKM